MLIDDLNWRYATKKFDPAKKLSEGDLATILEAANLAPTSSGVQPFRIVVVTRQDIKEQIRAVGMDQSPITDCSHLLVFAAWDNYTVGRLDAVADRMALARPAIADRMRGYYERLKALYLPRPAEVNYAHAARQAYIAFGIAIAQAAELKIDTTPMEGFDPDKVDEILGLRQQGLRSVTLLPLGYHAAEGDWNLGLSKVRKSLDEMVIRVD